MLPRITSFCLLPYGGLHNFYCLPDIISRANQSRRVRWAGQVARMGQRRNAYKILVGKPEKKRSL
jgi:hypothetical protein